MHEVVYICRTCQRLCGDGDLNCSPSLGPVDGEMQKLHFSLWQHDHMYACIISSSVTKQVPVSVLDKEAPDLHAQ